MQSRSLRYFLAVYDSGKLSVAADRVHVTQPALTRSIQSLEEKLGVPLFERHAHSLKPTQFADILVRHARRMDMEYQHALAEINMANGGSEALLRIGAGPIWYSQILPEAFTIYLKEYPLARLRVEAGVISTLLPQLLSGQVDLICSTLDFPMGAGLIREPILNVNHVIIAHESHPLYQEANPSRAFSPQEIHHYSWIILADDHVGTGRILTFFAVHGLPPPHFSLETSSPGHMFEMLTRGPWLAQIPVQMLTQAKRFGLKELPIQGSLWSAQAGICYRATDSLSPQLLNMIKIIKRVLG